jgi:hypothetical protein
MLKSPHIVKTVSQLHKNNSNIVHHRQQELPKVLSLLFFAGGEFNLTDLRNAVDKVGNVAAEVFPKSPNIGECVFNDIVQKSYTDTGHVLAHFGQDIGNLERVGKIRFTRLANLALVLAGREDVGLSENFQICVRLMMKDFLFKIFVANH